jgi:hypothetical protein
MNAYWTAVQSRRDEQHDLLRLVKACDVVVRAAGPLTNQDARLDEAVSRLLVTIGEITGTCHLELHP